MMDKHDNKMNRLPDEEDTLEDAEEKHSDEAIVKNEAIQEQQQLDNEANTSKTDESPTQILENNTDDEYKSTVAKTGYEKSGELVKVKTDHHNQKVDDVAINTSVESQPEKAGFWVRFWAYLIDVVVVFSLNGIILSPTAFFPNAAVFEWEYISFIGILSGLVLLYVFSVMTKGFEQTLGKMAMGIKVISTEQRKIAWGDLVFREIIGRFIHNVFFILKILYLVVAFTNEKQGIHDMIGNTRVVYAK